MNQIINIKKKYVTPIMEKVIIDQQISLQLDSYPPIFESESMMIGTIEQDVFVGDMLPL